MSLDLVSRSLDLDLEKDTNDQRKKQKNGSKRMPGSQNVTGLITTNRQGLRRELSKVERKQKKKAAEKKKKQKLKSRIEKYQEEHGQDYTQSNVEALKLIADLGKVSSDIAEKILYQHPCRLSRDVKQKSKEDESTPFSEKDFEKFAQDYTSSSR
ncbi:active regulator of sirt1-like [Plakobranchus ocellatus]|uniref:Active regulator of sirt1-like n=1 Tax=Plakobranchus ocellatus TaxID=259542 RepID=A0AAV4A330_9GAST|nr:active regulator of sirt1-like [Plakobranchus ocellatus]